MRISRDVADFRRYDVDAGTQVGAVEVAVSIRSIRAGVPDMRFPQPVVVRWAIVISMFVGATLVAWRATSPRALAQDQRKEIPQEPRDVDAGRKKDETRAAKELQDLLAVFPGKPVTIFSKDTGPIEAVRILKIVQFRGAGFLHLQAAKDGKNYLLRSENITLIRED